MLSLRKEGEYEVKPLPIIGKYNKQRFRQFSSEDTANWYIVPGENTKRPYAMYPVMGRMHINFGGVNRLQFSQTPRIVFRTINYWYALVGSSLIRIDQFYNQVVVSQGKIVTFAGIVHFDFLVVNQLTFVMLTDSEKIYVYEETHDTFDFVTDLNAPGNFTVNNIKTKPGLVVAFGNRFAVSCLNSSQFVLSVINLLNPDGTFDPLHCFSVGYNAASSQPGSQVFAQENGIIRQMGVLNNQLYIFTDFTTGIWSNSPAIFTGTGVTFPWKKNSLYDWNFGIANSYSMDINFGYLVFLAQNKDGLLQVMASSGGGDPPQKISDKAIDVLLQRYSNQFKNANPFLGNLGFGFLYQYENVVFYRISGGNYTGTQILDQEQTGNSIEYNFEIKEWHRCIELNGERNRIQQHVFFNSTHLVTVLNDSTMFEMSAFYVNEDRNTDQSDPQANDAYLAYPFRYERLMSTITQDDYSEFETSYVQIDFVFGESDINYSTSPFLNTKYIIDEQAASDGSPQYLVTENPDSDGQPIFIIADDTNFPTLNDKTYNYLFKPHVELYYSDDGGVSFLSADVRVFSQIGQYQWSMRWYQLGCSRNRVYKLIAVSPVPIVILGGVMNVRRSSGGSN